MTSQEIFFKHLAPTSHQPVLIEVESASGTIIKDVEGKQYYDLIAGVGVISVGHNNSLIKEAVIKQMNKHSHVMVYGEYIQSSVTALAKKLSDLLPEKLATSYLVNSGTEATIEYSPSAKLKSRMSSSPNALNSLATNGTAM